MTNHERQQEALTRAVSSPAVTNYPTIYAGFLEMGIPEDDIKPRENVFTFHAWKAQGRHVKKGQHGVRVVTYIPVKSRETDEQTGERQTVTRPWHTTVFHISQTEPNE